MIVVVYIFSYFGGWVTHTCIPYLFLALLRDYSWQCMGNQIWCRGLIHVMPQLLSVSFIWCHFKFMEFLNSYSVENHKLVSTALNIIFFNLNFWVHSLCLFHSPKRHLPVLSLLPYMIDRLSFIATNTNLSISFCWPSWQPPNSSTI